MGDRTASGKSSTIPALIDIPGLAVTLGISVRHVRRLVAERRIPYIKVGHLVRFNPTDVASWLERFRVDPIARNSFSIPNQLSNR